MLLTTTDLHNFLIEQVTDAHLAVFKLPQHAVKVSAINSKFIVHSAAVLGAAELICGKVVCGTVSAQTTLASRPRHT